MSELLEGVLQMSWCTDPSLRLIISFTCWYRTWSRPSLGAFISGSPAPVWCWFMAVAVTHHHGHPCPPLESDWFHPQMFFFFFCSYFCLFYVNKSLYSLQRCVFESILLLHLDKRPFGYKQSCHVF